MKSIDEDQSEAAGEPPVTFRGKKTTDPLHKKLQLEQEGEALQQSLAEGAFTGLKTRVAWIMNLFPNTRNSDVALSLKYWEMYQSDI